MAMKEKGKNIKNNQNTNKVKTGLNPLLARGIICFVLSVMFSFVCGSNIYSTEKDMFCFGILLFALIVLIAAFTESLAVGTAVWVVPSCIIALISYYKLKITGIAFSYADFSLWNKVGKIVELNKSSIRPTKISLFIVLEAVMVIVIALIADKKLPKVKLKMLHKLIYLAVFILVFAVIQPFNPKIGSMLKLWTSFVSREKNEEISLNIDDIIENAHLEEDEGPKPPAEKPNVIVILSESFFDVTGLEGVKYDKDPVSDFRRLSEEGISGRFFSPTMGYGTSSIEIEILTGISTRALGVEQTLSDWNGERFEKNDSIPKLFRNEGYKTAFLHSFNDEIYNRAKNYYALGFDEMYFSGDFKELLDPDLSSAGVEGEELTETQKYYKWLDEKYLKSSFFSDELVSDGIKSLIEKTDEPVFVFATTMENHTPYTADKYSAYEYTYEAELSQEEEGVLNAVTQGVANASSMLGNLAEYLKSADEPTVVVFFGDHKPNLPLSEESTLYNSLGIADPSVYGWDLEEIEYMYATDYLIWSNDSRYLLGNAGTRKDTSSSFLGLDILKYGGADYTKMWQLLAAERKIYTAWTWYYFIDSNGKITYTPKDTKDRNITLNTLYVSYYFEREFGGN